MFPITKIAGSGMAAERLRMEIIANNVANMQSTRSADGEPFRRQQVVFASVYDDAIGENYSPGANGRGVRVVSVEDDPSEFQQVYLPGHPDADEQGMVRFPNVSLPNEMVDLMTSSRAYEANMRVLKMYRQMVEETLSLLQGIR